MTTAVWQQALRFLASNPLENDVPDKSNDDKPTKSPVKKDEAAAKGLDTEPKIDAPIPPTHGSVKISLPVFLKQAGIRPDQSAGFVAFANAWRIDSNTVATWHELLDNFNKRPV